LREQKYRRYKLDTDNWNGIILKNQLVVLVGLVVLQFILWDKFFCTSNTGVNVNNAYLLSEPYEINAYTDLAKMSIIHLLVVQPAHLPLVQLIDFQLVIPKQHIV
jgi:hypothetical protein